MSDTQIPGMNRKNTCENWLMAYFRDSHPVGVLVPVMRRPGHSANLLCDAFLQNNCENMHNRLLESLDCQGVYVLPPDRFFAKPPLKKSRAFSCEISRRSHNADNQQRMLSEALKKHLDGICKKLKFAKMNDTDQQLPDSHLPASLTILILKFRMY